MIQLRFDLKNLESLFLRFNKWSGSENLAKIKLAEIVFWKHVFNLNLTKSGILNQKKKKKIRFPNNFKTILI